MTRSPEIRVPVVRRGGRYIRIVAGLQYYAMWSTIRVFIAAELSRYINGVNHLDCTVNKLMMVVYFFSIKISIRDSSE